MHRCKRSRGGVAGWAGRGATVIGSTPDRDGVMPADRDCDLAILYDVAVKVRRRRDDEALSVQGV